MSGPQWENLPEPRPDRPVTPLGASWLGFSADPRARANQQLRASDADRAYATRLVDQARFDGRLTPAEQVERAALASRARTIGELAPLVSDLVPAVGSTAHSPRGANRFARAGVMGWVVLAVMFNAIWLMTSLSVGHPIYYWPMWPMFGTAIPMVMGILANQAGSNRSSGRDSGRGRPQLPPGEDLR